MTDDAFFEAAVVCSGALRRTGITQALELLRVHRAEKPAVRLVVDDDEVILVTEFAAQTGLAVAAVRRRQREQRAVHGETFGEALAEGDHGGALPLYVGPAAAKLAEAESAGEPSERLGLALGLPPCCAISYCRVQRGEAWLSFWADPALGPIDAWGNVLAGHLQGWTAAGEYLPCHHDCAATIQRMRHGDALLRALGCEGLAEEARDARSRSVLILGPDLVFLPAGGEMLDARCSVVGPGAGVWQARLVRADEVASSIPGGRLLRFREAS